MLKLSETIEFHFQTVQVCESVIFVDFYVPTYRAWPIDVVDEANDAGGCYAEQREEDSCHPEHVQLQPLVGNLYGDNDNQSSFS